MIVPVDIPKDVSSHIFCGSLCIVTVLLTV